MNKVKVIDNLEIIYVKYTKRVVFTIETRLKIVQYYKSLSATNKSLFKQKWCGVFHKKSNGFDSMICTWNKDYNNGLYETSNTVAVARKIKTKTTITLDDKISDLNAQMLELDRKLKLLAEAKELLVA